MRLTRLGTVTLPEGQGESSLPIGARSSLVPLPGGAFDQDGNRLYLQSQRLSYRCVITDDIDETLDTLMREIGRGRRVLEAVLRDGTRRITWAKLVSVERESQPGMLGHQPIVLHLEQDYPYWLAGDDVPHYLDSGDALDGSWTLGGRHETFTIDGLLVEDTITNDGGAVVPLGLVRVELDTGDSVTDLKITNDENGLWIKRVGTLQAGDVWEVDFLTRTAQLNGTDDYANLALGDNQVDWMLLELGDNAITITATALTGAFDLVWYWGRHYL